MSSATHATAGRDAELPRLGRPRDPSRDVAILDATLSLLAETGYGALTMEAVATRAGVGKATLYRRWPGKEQLVVDALASLGEQVEVPRGADVRERLVVLLDTVRKRSGSRAARIFPRLISQSVDHPELMRRYRDQVITPRRARFRAVLEEAVAEGVVRDDVDLEHAIDLLIGPVAYRNLMAAERPPTREFVRRVVDDVLSGLTPRTTDQETS